MTNKIKMMTKVKAKKKVEDLVKRLRLEERMISSNSQSTLQKPQPKTKKKVKKSNLLLKVIQNNYLRWIQMQNLKVLMKEERL